MRQTARRDGLFHTQPKVLEEEASLTVVHTHLYIRPSALDLLRWLFYIYTGSLSLSRLSYRGDGSIVGWSAAVFDTHPSVRCPVRSSSSPTAVKLTPDFQKISRNVSFTTHHIPAGLFFIIIFGCLNYGQETPDGHGHVRPLTESRSP